MVQETYLDAVVSYTIDVSMDAKLSFGLKAGGNMLNLDFNGLRNFDQEVVNQNNIDNKFTPNFGLGVYYHTDKFYAGVSAPNVLESEYFDNDNSGEGVNFLSASLDRAALDKKPSKSASSLSS